MTDRLPNRWTLDPHSMLIFGDIVFGVVVGMAIDHFRPQIGMPYIVLYLGTVALAVHYWFWGRYEAYVLIRAHPRELQVTDLLAVVAAAFIMGRIIGSAAERSLAGFAGWFVLWAWMDSFAQLMQLRAVRGMPDSGQGRDVRTLIIWYYCGPPIHIRGLAFAVGCTALWVVAQGSGGTPGGIGYGILGLVLVNEAVTTILRRQTLGRVMQCWKSVGLAVTEADST